MAGKTELDIAVRSRRGPMPCPRCATRAAWVPCDRARAARCCRRPVLAGSLAPGAGRAAVDVGNQPPWRGVVRVQTDVGVQCTGALVGPNLVVTAAHCLFGRNTGRVVRPGSVHVLTSYAHGDYAGHARAVALEIGTGFALGVDGQRLPASPVDGDWAMLTLDAPLGTPDRVLPLARALPPAGSPVMLGGYEQDRAQIMVADLDCRMLGLVRAGDALLLHHSCAATRGASGAPLLGQVPGLGWAVLGVAAVAGVGAAGGYAVPAATIAMKSKTLP